MADETAANEKTVLGQSQIFTPEVINDIHMKAELGRYRMRGFSMFKKIPHWDELMFLPGTLTRFVIEGYREKCETKTVLGARFAKKPIELDIPIYITGMSFGALSIEAKMALAKGASMAGTATCSGEGGMIPPERDLSTKWYYQIIQSRYGFNPHHLMLADAVEFFIGQGCKVGLGGHLMGQKVTEQVAEMRSLPPGIDQRSPARHPDWLGPDDLSLKIQETREATNYEIPIQLKLGAARVYDDVRMAAKCGPDIIYLDGAEGGTGAGPHIATEETGIPLMAAIPEARRALEDVGLADEIDLVVAGGIRNGGDIAKCIALGANAVSIGTSALIALGSHKEIEGTDYEGDVRRPGEQLLPLAHRSRPGGHHHPGPRAAQAAERRRGGRAGLQLPAHPHARGADARPGVRQDRRAQPRAGGPLRADDGGGRDGEGPARGHQLHPRCHRGARAGAHRAPARARTWRTPSTSCPSPRRSRDERLRTGHARASTPRSSRGSATRTRRTRRSWTTSTWRPRRRATTSTGSRTSTSSWRTARRPSSTATPTRSSRSTSPSRRGRRTTSRARCSSSTCRRATPTASSSRRPTRSSRSPSSARGSRARGRSARTTSHPSWRAGSLRCTDVLSPKLPASVTHLVIGAGVHGLSTAWHLAADGEDVLVVDKTGIAAGASGIACGVVRNNYFQPAMAGAHGRLRRGLGVRPRGVQLPRRPATSRSALPASRATSPRSTSARSASATRRELHLGAEAVERHMRSLYSDWRAPGLTVCLHEHAGGFAFNKESMLGLADKARRAGAQIVEGVEVTGFEFDNSQARHRGGDERGTHRGRAGRRRRRPVGRVAVGDARPARPARRAPARRQPRRGPADVDVLVPAGGRGRGRSGDVRHRRRARVRGPPRRLRPAAAAPTTATLVTEESWGIYFKPDRESVQGGAAPLKLGSRVRGRPVPDRHRRPRLPRHVVGGAEPLPGPLRGRAAEVPAAALRRRRAPSRWTTSPCSTTCGRTCSSPPTPTTATR